MHMQGKTYVSFRKILLNIRVRGGTQATPGYHLNKKLFGGVSCVLRHPPINVFRLSNILPYKAADPAAEHAAAWHHRQKALPGSGQYWYTAGIADHFPC